MGMYNEVFKKCPECGLQAVMQIPQLVLGFGGFDLDNRETLLGLTEEQLRRLKDMILDDDFRCECGHYFNPYRVSNELKLSLIKELFGP